MQAWEIKLRTFKSYLLAKNGGELPIKPGMTVSVDILTGKKTVMDYILKPLFRAKHTALRER